LISFDNLFFSAKGYRHESKEKLYVLLMAYIDIFYY